LGYKTGGRKAGTPNKDTSERVATIEAAFAAIGGADALARWAKKNPGDFYCKVWARLLPREIQLEGRGEFAFDIVERLKRARERAAAHGNGMPEGDAAP
jgi:hypothetical protein